MQKILCAGGLTGGATWLISSSVHAAAEQLLAASSDAQVKPIADDYRDTLHRALGQWDEGEAIARRVVGDNRIGVDSELG